MTNKLLNKADERSIGFRQWYIFDSDCRISIVAECNKNTNRKAEWFITNYDSEWHPTPDLRSLPINRGLARDLFNNMICALAHSHSSFCEI